MTGQQHCEKLLANAGALADLLHAELPELPVERPEDFVSVVTIDLSNPFKDAECARAGRRRDCSGRGGGLA